MNYFNLIDINDSVKWNEIVTSFHQYDVYYLSNYVKAFKIHGDGEPWLVYYDTDELRGINVVMKRDISQFVPLANQIAPGCFYDIVTPYGYGGFLFEGDTSDAVLKRFYGRYVEYMNKNHVVSEFVRFHPQLNNADPMRIVDTVVDLGKTIAIDLTSVENIWSNFSCDNRTQIRKSEKSGIEIHHDKSLELLDFFMNMYNVTMDKDQADTYYYFEKAFYESIHTDLHDNYEIFYAVMNGKIIAMAIMIYANYRMHCHLMASIYKYRTYAPSNLLLFEAACWGNKQGFKTMHLGGGIGAEEDNLFRFKKTFNRHSNEVFSTGKEIFDKDAYDSLVELRKEANSIFDCNSSFFPLYRAL